MNRETQGDDGCLPKAFKPGPIGDTSQLHSPSPTPSHTFPQSETLESRPQEREGRVYDLSPVQELHHKQPFSQWGLLWRKGSQGPADCKVNSEREWRQKEALLTDPEIKQNP